MKTSESEERKKGESNEEKPEILGEIISYKFPRDPELSLTFKRILIFLQVPESKSLKQLMVDQGLLLLT